MINVTCAIIVKDDKVLVTKRGPGMHLAGYWEFPGGKVKEGESAIDCIKREIKEELNLDIHPLSRLASCEHVYDNQKHINLIPFIAELKGGELKLIDHCEAIWCQKEELQDLNWCPADVPIVGHFVQSWGS